MASIQNLASGVLTADITSSATSLGVSCGSGSSATLTAVWPNTPFFITVMPSRPVVGVANSLDSEIMKVTALSVANNVITMTVTRAQKNTSAKAFSEGAIVTNGIYIDDILDNVYPVGTSDIEDGAVTSEKLDASTNMKMVLLDTINAANIPYMPSGMGLALDIRKYFANNSTATNRPMVFDELRLKFDIGLTETSNIHYLRFGVQDGASNLTIRNMLSFDDGGTVSGNHTEGTNLIVGMRLGSNTEIRVFPYGGTDRIPTLADNLTLVTICDNSSVNFTSSGTRVNFNSLYRMQYSNNKMYIYQSDLDQTLFSGVIKVYGIKYPTG